MHDDTTGRFARLETKMEGIEKLIVDHVREDRDERKETRAAIERLSWRLALIVGGITAAGAVLQLLAHGGS